MTNKIKWTKLNLEWSFYHFWSERHKGARYVWQNNLVDIQQHAMHEKAVANPICVLPAHENYKTWPCRPQRSYGPWCLTAQALDQCIDGKNYCQDQHLAGRPETLCDLEHDNVAYVRTPMPVCVMIVSSNAMLTTDLCNLTPQYPLDIICGTV